MDANQLIDYEYWVCNLSESQTRALASQAGIAGWVTYPLTKLRSYLMGNENAQAIYEANYVAV